MLPHFKYSRSFYEGKSLKEFAKLFISCIPSYFEKDKTVLVCSGSSGSMIAAAMIMLEPKLRTLYVYPPKMVSHRGANKRLSGDYTDLFAEANEFVFVDDVIDNGNTLIGTMRELHSELNACGVSGEVDIHAIVWKEYESGSKDYISDCKKLFDFNITVIDVKKCEEME